jgi:hypothetical protein
MEQGDNSGLIVVISISSGQGQLWLTSFSWEYTLLKTECSGVLQSI